MENPISLRWGLVGTTGFADRIFAPALKQASQVLAGAASSTVEHSDSFAERHGCPNSYASVEDLLNDPDMMPFGLPRPTISMNCTLRQPSPMASMSWRKASGDESMWMEVMSATRPAGLPG